MFPLYDLLPHRRFPWMTVLIILANVAVQVWMTQAGQQQAVETAYRYGFIPDRVSEIGKDKDLVVPVPEVNARGEVDPNADPHKMRLSVAPASVYLTFFTTMFLHGGWLHLASNMWMLWIFGNNIEDRLGHLMYACYYLLGGIVATLAHFAVDPHSQMPVVGASGAVAAVLGGYAISYPKAKVKTLVFLGMVFIVDMPALVLLGFWFVLETIMGMVQLGGDAASPVANWAHVGGFIAGIVLLPFFTLGAAPPGTDWRKEAEELFRFDAPSR